MYCCEVETTPTFRRQDRKGTHEEKVVFALLPGLLSATLHIREHSVVRTHVHLFKKETLLYEAFRLPLLCQDWITWHVFSVVYFL